jgi:polyphosphate kinase 2
MARIPPPYPTDLVAAYREALRELTALRHERTSVGRRLRAERRLRPWQVELLKLQRHLEHENMRMIVLFEGRDAAGKGGAIRRVTRFMNEKQYRVVALGRPTEEQRSQWYFQRFVAQFPVGGEIVMFDRSWYNQAMVERVFGFCSPKEYQDFLRGVTGFEKDLVRQGTVLIKLYFSVTREEQARRFERRRTDPVRRWKLSEIDLQAQDRWDDFTRRKYEMLVRTDMRAASWVIVRSNDKERARLNTMKIILNAVDYKERNPDLDFTPDPRIVVAGADELALMQAERRRSGRFIG